MANSENKVNLPSRKKKLTRNCPFLQATQLFYSQTLTTPYHPFPLLFFN